MANNNFVVQNGLTVGPLTINAATGDIVTTGNITSTSSVSNDAVNTLSANIITAGSSSGNIAVTGNVIPSANITYALGSRTMMWKDVFVGPGTLYINGTPVLGASTTGTPTINMTASAGQNIAVATNGGGILQLDGGSAGGGYIQVKSPLQIAAGSNLTSSDGNAIQFANQIGVDALTSHSANTNLTITAQGTGKVAINTDTIIAGNLTVNGVTETINTTNLLVSDQYIQMNNGVTGTPTLDAGIRVTRGSSNNSVLKWAESVQAWQISSDNTTYGNIATQGFVSSAISAATPTANSLTGTTLAASVVNSSLTSVGTLTGLTVAGTVSASTVSATTLTGTLSTAAQTNVTSVGTLTGLTVSGAISASTNNSINIGSSGSTFATVYATTFSGVSTTAKYADLAENYQADKAYPAGTVLMFGGSAEVTSADADTTAVAGVVSTNPAHLMNGGLQGANVVPLALQGRVPCNVIGPVKKGDLMVSAGFGYAKADNSAKVGTVIGKALQEVAFAGKAVIEVVVGRV